RPATRRRTTRRARRTRRCRARRATSRQPRRDRANRPTRDLAAGRRSRARRRLRTVRWSATRRSRRTPRLRSPTSARRRPRPARRRAPRPRLRARSSAVLLNSRSRRGAAHRHLTNQHRRLPRRHRHALALLAAHAGPRLEVVADRVDEVHHFGAVADELRGSDRPGYLAAFDEVRLGDAEHEVAGCRIDLTAAELHAIDAVLDAADDLVG